MPVSPLNKLVASKIAGGRIRPDDAREILEVIEKDTKYSPKEIRALKKLAALPGSKFKNEDEFIPNPYDAEDGMTVKAQPKRWIQSSLELATAKLSVRRTIPGVSVALSPPKLRKDADFGDHISRDLTVTFKGKAAEKDGTIDFSYGKRHVKLDATKGTSMEKIYYRLSSALTRAERGSITVRGFFDSAKTGTQKIVFEVL
ncbi:MAG: hypothetical protein ACOZIN_04910 [Myxococcota bacterium]